MHIHIYSFVPSWHNHTILTHSPKLSPFVGPKSAYKLESQAKVSPFAGPKSAYKLESQADFVKSDFALMGASRLSYSKGMASIFIIRMHNFF
jgi:hypothetical protein